MWSVDQNAVFSLDLGKDYAIFLHRQATFLMIFCLNVMHNFHTSGQATFLMILSLNEVHYFYTQMNNRADDFKSLNKIHNFYQVDFLIFWLPYKRQIEPIDAAC